MAFMEHICTDPNCDEVIMNNSTVREYCPKCGSPMMRTCDEDLEKD